MAISPPSDIINDVVRAADPARWQAAAQKLNEGASAVADAGFDEALQATGFSRPSLGSDPYSLRMALKTNSALSATGKASDTHQKFEAFVLQTFIESMLPKDSGTTFGKGTAGGIWKSMMAEQLGNQIAKAGGIGIAARLAARKS